MQYCYYFKAVHYMLVDIYFNTKAFFSGVPVILNSDFI